MVYLDPKKIRNAKTKLETIFPSPNAKHIVLEKDNAKKPRGKRLVENLKFYQIKISRTF